MVVLEAMASGVPVVAARIGGVPDLIEAGVTGLFCDPNNSASMEAGVKELLDNSAQAGEMARRARAESLRRFHPEVIARRHIEIYQEVVRSDS